MNVSAPTAGYTTDSTAPLRWRNPRDVEFNFARAGTEWTEARCTVANVHALPSCCGPDHGNDAGVQVTAEGSGSRIVLQEPCFSQAFAARFDKANQV